MPKSEKIIVQDLNILFVCLSEKWSTIERKAIFDASYLRDVGGSPTLFCVRGSMLDKKAEEESIERVYITKSKITKSLNIKFFKEFRKLVHSKRFDVVHCYNLKTIWLASILLKSNKTTVLFCSLNQNIKHSYKNPFIKWLLRRVDKVFTLSEELAEYIKESFSIHHRKVSVVGCGIPELAKKERETNKIGVIFHNYSELKNFRQAIGVFRQLKEYAKEEYNSLELYLLVGPRIYNRPRFKKELTAVEHEFYQGDIFLSKLSEEKINDLSILLCLEGREPITDYEVAAMTRGIPVLWPRTLSRQGLLYRYGKIGDSYAISDMREARSKLYYMVKYYENYVKVLNKRHESLVEDHGLEKYVERLSLHYERSLSLRRRHAQKTAK